jgi:hypothetical protein
MVFFWPFWHLLCIHGAHELVVGRNLARNKGENGLKSVKMIKKWTISVGKNSKKIAKFMQF